MLKYSKIPYIRNGRDFDGCDCFGLVALYYKCELGIELFDIFSGSYTHSELENSWQDWDQINISDANKNDVVFIKNGISSASHCGVMIDKYRCMQIVEDKGVVVIRLSNITVESVFRYRGLTK